MKDVHLVMPDSPTLFLIAGPNGAGKTTLASTFLPGFTHVKEFVNADLIARGLSPFAAESALITAGRILLERIDQLIDERQSFALETTLSGKGHLPLITRARSLGYKIALYYIYLDSPSMSVERVALRVSLGGHNVPLDVIRRRYERSLHNLFHDFLPIVDEWKLLDNSKHSIDVIAEGQVGSQTVYKPDIFTQLQSNYARK